MFYCLFVVALSSPAGKGLTSWLYCDFVTFPCGVLGQVWCLIVSRISSDKVSNLPKRDVRFILLK